MEYRLHRVRAEDWQHGRAIRLQMLRDTPAAYLETFEEALAHPDSEWQFRATRSAGPGNIGVAAVDGSGIWVGTMSGFLPEPGIAKLVSVWLHPDHRGSGAGVAALMLDAVIRWARDEEKAKQLVLLVHEDNRRAIAFYERAGFSYTGRTEPYPLDESKQELEMELPLEQR
ncbi:N-acetyltransferase [Streptomyces sp900116325]|uniref:GNAT family N-acetyltransferase n=1 Tax=Streptomyces sp. 900116325 TaxID=3154295 RepID=UPI0033C88B77